MKLKRTIIAPALVAGVALVSGGWLLQNGVSEQRNVYETARVFDEVMSLISDRYVDRTAGAELYRMATEGMIRELGDPHTTFLTPEEFNEFYTNMSGEYAGIGAQIVDRDGWVTVLAPLPQSPAERAGLQAGDRIIEIDGRSTRGWNSDQAVKQLRGPRGEAVNLRVVRIGVEEPISFRLVREEIHLSSVPYAFLLGDGVGYINLSIFSESSSREVREAIQKLRGQGMTKLIFDLRENPGGLLDQGVAVADLFLRPGLAVVETRGRIQSDNTVARTRDGEIAPGMPIVVLVDEYSASAAEIVAGALQDHDRALVVGARTFGKGSVQDLFPLSGGNFLKVTTSKWYTPVGRSIERDRRRQGDRVAVAPAAPATVDEEGQPIPGGSDTTKAYRTDSGRIVYGGGGIVPDVIIRPDTATEAEQEFFREAAKGGSTFNDVLFRYAIEYGRQNSGIGQNIQVTPEMRRTFYERLRAAGLNITWEQFEGARDFLNRRLAQEIVQHKFGSNAAAQRAVAADKAVMEAFSLLRRADAPEALIRLAPQQPPRSTGRSAQGR
ncbi:MAG TPA: S41 family peptidase [Longimicrobiaceae bacterium]|nr:S41 family peptidase [Longimicrobiaceae bacterium]